MKLNINKKLLFQFIKENSLSKNSFAIKCGISVGSLNKFIAGKGKVRLTTLVKILNYTGFKCKDLIE